MKVYIAMVTHRYGSNYYVGKTRAELYTKLADYCRESWVEISDSLPKAESTEDGTLPAPTMDNESIVGTYFDTTNERGTEFYDEGADEINASDSGVDTARDNYTADDE